MRTSGTARDSPPWLVAAAHSGRGIYALWKRRHDLIPTCRTANCFDVMFDDLHMHFGEFMKVTALNELPDFLWEVALAGFAGTAPMCNDLIRDGHLLEG